MLSLLTLRTKTDRDARGWIAGRRRSPDDRRRGLSRGLNVQQHAREKYQAVHVRGPLVRLAAVLHRRRIFSCEQYGVVRWSV